MSHQTITHFIQDQVLDDTAVQKTEGTFSEE